MIIFVKSIPPQTFTLEGLEPDDTVGEIMLKMSEIHDHPEFHTDYIRLIFAGKSLENYRLLEDYGIKN